MTGIGRLFALCALGCLLGCTALQQHASVSVTTVASPTPPRYINPMVEGAAWVDRIAGFVGYGPTYASQNKPTYGPTVGVSIRVWP